MKQLQRKYTLQQARQIVFNKYPGFLATYRLHRDFDPQLYTSENGMPLAKLNRKILPSLVTNYLNGDGSNNDQQSCLASRRPVIVEYWDESDGDGKWKFASAQDGLSIDEDGAINLPGLRELGVNYRNDLTDIDTDNPIPDGCGGDVTLIRYRTCKFYARNLRFTVAIPLDHKLLHSFKLASDPTTGLTPLTSDVDDSEEIDATFSRLYYADTDSLYRKDILASHGDGSTLEAPGSWTLPESIPRVSFDGGNGVTLGDPEADQGGAVQDDTAYIKNHIERKGRDLGRLDRGGYLLCPSILPTFHVGDQIDKMVNFGGGNGDYTIRGCVQEIHYLFKSKPQWTVLVIG